MSLIKQSCGEFWAIGGKPEELIPLALSLHNWGAITLPIKFSDDYNPLTDNEDYLNLGNPNDFIYILATKDRYLRARSKCFVVNWPFNLKGASGKLSWGLANLKAKREFLGIKTKTFISNK